MSRGSVLVVDDEPTIGEVVSRYLRARGLRDARGAEAARGAGRGAERAPDLIVLDLMLPGSTGSR